MTSTRNLASAGPSGLALASDDAEGTIYLLSGMSRCALVKPVQALPQSTSQSIAIVAAPNVIVNA